MFPSLRDHHQHRVRKFVATHMQEFKNLVERCGIRSTGGTDWEDSIEVAWKEIGLNQSFTSSHPIAIALNGVDFPVVSDESEWMG